MRQLDLSLQYHAGSLRLPCMCSSLHTQQPCMPSIEILHLTKLPGCFVDHHLDHQTCQHCGLQSRWLLQALFRESQALPPSCGRRYGPQRGPCGGRRRQDVASVGASGEEEWAPGEGEQIVPWSILTVQDRLLVHTGSTTFLLTHRTCSSQ